MARVRYRANTAGFVRLNSPAGDVGSWMDDVAREAATLARAAVLGKPSRGWLRTGNLARSIDWDRGGTNQYGTNRGVSASASYAAYVHDGTTGPITAGGQRMPIGVPGYSQGAIAVDGGQFAREVSGQDSYPFLRNGMNLALMRHGLRPIRSQ